jgi:hypothetical protein
MLPGLWYLAIFSYDNTNTREIALAVQFCRQHSVVCTMFSSSRKCSSAFTLEGQAADLRQLVQPDGSDVVWSVCSWSNPTTRYCIIIKQTNSRSLCDEIRNRSVCRWSFY